jgi:hypothetical protein
MSWPPEWLGVTVAPWSEGACPTPVGGSHHPADLPKYLMILSHEPPCQETPEGSGLSPARKLHANVNEGSSAINFMEIMDFLKSGSANYSGCQK